LRQLLAVHECKAKAFNSQDIAPELLHDRILA